MDYTKANDSKNAKDKKQDSNSLEEAISSELKSEVKTKKDNVDIKDDSQETKNTINNANKTVLLKHLSPEIGINEKHKRGHKWVLLALLTCFILFQFWTVYIFTDKTLSYCFSDTAKIELIDKVFVFISAYITSVVIELIAILKYIVKNVFDTSINDLLKLFKEESEKR